MLFSTNEESSKKKVDPDFRINKQFIRSITKRNKQTNEKKKTIEKCIEMRQSRAKKSLPFFASSFIIPRETCDTTEFNVQCMSESVFKFPTHFFAEASVHLTAYSISNGCVRKRAYIKNFVNHFVHQFYGNVL